MGPLGDDRNGGGRMTRVAIQGEVGSFSHMAAIQARGPEVQIVAERTFPDAFRAVEQGRADVAVIPVENSLAGPVVESLDPFWGSGLTALAETHVRIELTLVSTEFRPLARLRSIASHPVALRQCRRLFDAHPHIEAVVEYDTAGSIQALMDGTAEYDAAIGSPLAARLHGATVLAHNVEDDARNFTRFLVLGPADSGAVVGRRAAFSVTTENRPGALLRVLTPIAEEDVDLTQVVTRPIPGEPWHYRFHMEVAGPSPEHTRRALEGVRQVATECRVFGLYDRVQPM